MTNEDVKRNIWRNTASNYLCLGLRLVLGLVMFRLLYRTLPPEHFGFWALLWTVFGYGVLLDFGFGFTAQKRVAELSVKREWNQLGRVLSTIFFAYVGIGAFIAIAGSVLAGPFLDWVHVSSGNRAAFREVLICFFCGLGFAFPLGLFPEMLRGQQRIALANLIFCLGLIANFVLSVVALRQGWGLKALFLIAISCTLVPDCLCGVVALRRLPQVKIRPGLFSRAMVRETMRFSLFAYLTTVSNVLLGKTDQLILSSALSVSVITLYQAGAKVAEMFTSLGLQLPDALSPAAAHLHARGDRQDLRQLLIQGTRFTVMIATPLYLICAFYMDGLLRVLTGDAVRTTFWVGQVLLLWSYTTVVTQSVAKRVYMMCGHERRLMYLALGEAIFNLILSVVLVLIYRNSICVAVGSLVATFVFGGFLLWPWAAREAELSGWKLARIVLGPTWLACMPLVILGTLERSIPVLDFRDSLLLLIIEGLGALVIGGCGLWRLALTPLERDRFSAACGRLIAKRTPA